MVPVTINYWAVLVATIAAMAIGALWYSPLLFAKQWMKEVGKGAGDMNQTGPVYALTAVTTFMTAYILAHFVAYAVGSGSSSAGAGALTGLWAWLGFVVPMIGSEHLFSGKTKNLYLITVGHYLLSLVVMGAILGAWV